MMEQDDAETVMWQGRFITAKTRGKWEYVSRARGIKAAVILAMEADHVLLVEQYRVPLGANCIELPAGLIGGLDTSGLQNIQGGVGQFGTAQGGPAGLNLGGFDASRVGELGAAPSYDQFGRAIGGPAAPLADN